MRLSHQNCQHSTAFQPPVVSFLQFELSKDIHDPPDVNGALQTVSVQREVLYSFHHLDSKVSCLSIV